MKTKTLSTILTCVNFLLVQGLALGSSSNNPDTNSSRRILHATAAARDFAFLVKLEIEGSTGAGAIIAEHWILTAAHCIYGHVCSAVVKIFAAVWQPGLHVIPLECYTHPHYSEKTLGYDVGLIKVQKNLLQDGRARAIPLPAPGAFYPPGSKVVIAGWGKTEYNSHPGGPIRGNFRVERWEYCNNIHREAYCAEDTNPNCAPVNMPRRVLCLRGEGSPPAGTCLGDSGAPAVINSAVAGIVSYRNAKGSACNVGDPTMSTSVADYLPWIYTFVPSKVDICGIPVQPEV